MQYSQRVDEAFLFAHACHREQVRKGTGIPYLTHLMAVAALVGEFGGSENQVIAALLHDAPEDQGGEATLARIRDEFGDEVAALVDACTDAYTQPKPPWRPRKEAFVKRLSSAPEGARLIVAADKLHNMESMTREFAAVGPALWERFTASPAESLWYHATVASTLREGWEHPILDALHAALGRFEEMVAASD